MTAFRPVFAVIVPLTGPMTALGGLRRSQVYAAWTVRMRLDEAAEKVECFFSPENLIIEMIPDFVLFGIIFSILARLFLSKCAF